MPTDLTSNPSRRFGLDRALSRAGAGLRITAAWSRALFRAIKLEGLDYRATSLAYTTLVAIVPGLALCFALLRTFGVDEHLEPMLLQLLAPLGEKGPELTQTILRFVRKINVGVLGFAGLAVLIVTIISALGKIEAAFNHIWRVTEARSLSRRASDYVSVVLLGPVLIFSAIGLTASMPGTSALRRLVGREPFGLLVLGGSKILPFLLVIAAFTFVYLYIPNTRVPWRAALFGGALGGLAWKLAGLLFAEFISNSSSYHAIYSSLVIAILFMLWLDLSWLILLLGGQAALYFQHPHYVQGHSRYPELSNRLKERLGLSLMLLIAGRFVRGQPPWTLDDLADRLSLPWETVKDTLEVLQTGGLLERTGRGDESFIPACDLAGISVRDVLRALRESPEDQALATHAVFTLPEIAALADQLEQLAEDRAAEVSLRELALSGGHGTPELKAGNSKTGS